MAMQPGIACRRPAWLNRLEFIHPALFAGELMLTEQE